MTGRRRKSGLATSVCIGLILLLFGDSGGNTDAGGPSSLTLDRTIEGNQLFANGIPNESGKVPLEVRPSNAENEETRQRLLRTPRKTKQEEEQEERRRVEAQSEEDEGGIDGDNGDENGGEDYNLDTSSDSNASDIRSHEDTAEEVEDKRVKDLDRKADESEKGSKERDNHDGRSLDDARSSNAKSKFGEVRSADSAGKSSSAKAITEDFIRLSRNNGLNTVTEKPSSTSPSSSVDEGASKREDKRSSREETTVEAHSVETTTKSDVTGPTNGKLNDNLEIRKNLEVADLESASLPKARDRTEDGISLINDTRVNYNHYYKTLTESDGDGSDLLHRKKAVGPKQEVEIVSNTSHPAILRIEARNDTDSINGTASERNFVANENELYQANEENRHVGLGEAADQEGKNPASSTIANDHDGKAIVSSTGTAYPADQGQLTTERGVNSSLVAKGRTIALSDVNEFPDVETKTTTDGTKPREFDRKDFSERRPPYPYVKSSRDPSSTESSSTTTLPSGTMDKAKEDEASAYENTINTGQSENKFVVTEASVVLENSIQQSRPNDRRSSEETSSSNRTSEPPAPSRSLSSTSVGDNDDSDDRVSPADVAPTRHTHVADSRASDVDLSWNSTRVANVDNEVVRGNSGNGSRSNEQHGFDVSNAITETSSITIEPLPGDTTIAYRQSSISGAVGSTSTGVPPTEDHRIDETVEVSRDVQTNAEESMLLKESTLNVTEASVEYPSVIGENFDEVRQSNAKKDISISSTIASLESLAETTASKVVDTAIATNGSSSPAVTAESSTTDTALVSESLESNPSDEAIKATTMASTGVEYEFVGLTDATTTTTTTTTRNSSKALDFFVESSSTTESENNTEEIPLTVKEISASTSLTTTVQEASTEAIKDSMSNVESQPITVSLRDSTETEMPTISDTTMLPSMSVANETTTTTTATTTRPITSTESTDVDSTLMRTTTENEDGVNNGAKNVDGEVNASTTNRNDDLRNATTSNRSSVEPFARHNSAFVDETTTFLTRSTVSPAFSSTARPGFSVPSTVATKRASTGVWSSATSSNVVTGPPNEEGIKIFSADKITSMIKMDIEGTCQEVCPHLDTLRQCLAELLTNKKNKRVSEKQIKFHQNPCLDESILATSSSGGPIFSILLYVVDENDKFDNAMTKILPSLFKDNDVKFPLTVHSFLLVPEMDSGNAIAAVIVSSVACICLVLLAGLLFIMRKRQTRFNYGERCRPVSLDAYSLDSVSAYNSVRRKGVVRSSKRSYGNPTFEDSSAIPSHPLNFAGLSSFCGDVNAINEEFSGIPQVTAKIDELPPGAEIKNRYANVIPLPETRVPLQRINSDPITEYINASYVRGPKNATKYYIACQAPLESTITDFWRMIWEQQCKVIIMLTDLFENGVEKCSEYIPPSEVTDCHRLYGDFQVTLKKRETKEKYAISTLLFKNLENNTFREVYHIWYLWPTSGVQSDGAGLIAVLLEARALQRGGPGPIVVHCSPGTGRTGTLIALDLGIRQYEITRTVDVPRVVYTIRRDRAGAVQTKEQYAFIYKALNLYATKLAGGVLEST